MSIYPIKKNGKLTGRLRVEVQGRYQRYRTCCHSIGEARTKEAEFKALAAEGAPPPAAKAPVSVIERVQPAKAPEVAHTSSKLSTARKAVEGALWDGVHEANCLSKLKLIEELMGDVALNDITTKFVGDLRVKLKETRKCSDGTINRYFACVSAFLKWAIKNEHRSVTELPELTFRKEAEGRIRWITPEEETVLMATLPERTAKLARFAILTGMRRGELLALQPDQIEPTRVSLWGAGTKSGKNRSIRLNEESYALAKWLFIEGNAPTANTLRRDWDKARKDMKLDKDPEFVFHATRHTFATRAVDAGVPIRTLQIMLGHETIEMTERYGKVTGKALDAAMDMMFAKAA